MSERGRLGSFTPDRADMREVLADPRTWCGIGIVVARDGGAHYEIIDDDSGNPVDVLVEVDFMPKREPLYCRLGAVAGGPGSGIWRIPPAGTEVYVAIPGGQLDGLPLLIAVLSSRNVPAALDADTLVVINPGKVIIASKDDKVSIGATDGVGCQPAVVGDDLTTRLETIESKINTIISHTHSHPADGVQIPVSSNIGTAISSPPNVKSAKVEIKK
jgi:hypothetical protein